MGDIMTFPATVEEFMEQYKMTDTEHVYSNGTEYVPIYRMKQWFEHCRNQQRPTVDAVPVVRCMECKYFMECKYLMFSDCYGECSKGHLGIVMPHDFCSYGERKGGQA